MQGAYGSFEEYLEESRLVIAGSAGAKVAMVNRWKLGVGEVSDWDEKLDETRKREGEDNENSWARGELDPGICPRIFL